MYYRSRVLRDWIFGPGPDPEKKSFGIPIPIPVKPVPIWIPRYGTDDAYAIQTDQKSPVIFMNDG